MNTVYGCKRDEKYIKNRPIFINLEVSFCLLLCPHLLNGAKSGVIDVKGGATLAKHRFALAIGKHKVGDY